MQVKWRIFKSNMLPTEGILSPTGVQQGVFFGWPRSETARNGGFFWGFAAELRGAGAFFAFGGWGVVNPTTSNMNPTKGGVNPTASNRFPTVQQGVFYIYIIDR